MILSTWTSRNNESQFSSWSWEQIDNRTGDLVKLLHTGEAQTLHEQATCKIEAVAVI